MIECGDSRQHQNHALLNDRSKLGSVHEEGLNGDAGGGGWLSKKGWGEIRVSGTTSQRIKWDNKPKNQVVGKLYRTHRLQTQAFGHRTKPQARV